MKNSNTRRGFTLIELLVVVLIIGILAAVAVPQYQKAVEKSRIAEAVTVLNSLKKAYQLCVLEHGEPDLNGTHPCDANNANGFFANMTIEIPGTPLDDCDTPGCFATQDWRFDYENCRVDAYRYRNGTFLYLISSSVPNECGGISPDERFRCDDPNQTGICQKICGSDNCLLK